MQRSHHDSKVRQVPNSSSQAKASRALTAYDPLYQYLADVTKFDTLTREEEWELSVRLKDQGDKEAAYELVVCNLRLVVKIAMGYHRKGANNLLDLIQEGNTGLIHAVQRYDPYRGVKFSYYASFWIKAYIMKFLMDNFRLVKLGTTQEQRKLFYRLRHEKLQLEKEGFHPEPKLLSQKLNIDEKTVAEVDQRLTNQDISLNTYLSDESDTERINLIPTETESPEEMTYQHEISQMLRAKLNAFKKTITEREVYILEERMLSDNPQTLQKLGDRFGICRERVRQLESRILQKLKSYFYDDFPEIDMEGDPPMMIPD